MDPDPTRLTTIRIVLDIPCRLDKLHELLRLQADAVPTRELQSPQAPPPRRDDDLTRISAVKPICLLTLQLVLVCSTLPAQSPAWRGDGTGHYPDAQPPTHWSPDGNVVWQLDLPGRGYSSPALSDDRLLLTAEPDHVLCVDASSGKLLWQDQAGYAAALGEAEAARIEEARAKLEGEKRELKQVHDKLRESEPDSKETEQAKQTLQDKDDEVRAFEQQYPPQKRGGAGNAAPTGVCDGERFYTGFGTGIVAAYELGGRRLWIRHIEAPHNNFGHSASPVLAAGKLIVHYQDLVALDPATGKELWRTELKPRFGTSVAVTIDDQDVLVTPSGALVRADDGKILADKLFSLSSNSPLVHDGIVYAHESGSIKALRLPENLDEPVEAELLWESKSSRDQRMASAAYHDGILYAGGRQGILDVTDARTGESLYRKRLDVGQLFSSFTVAGDYLYISGKDGKTLVLRPGREYDEVAVNPLQRSSSSPVFIGKRMYFRTDDKLYCIGE